MPFFGFGITAQTLVGNSIGRGENKKAQFFGNETAKLATFYAIIIGIIFLIIPNWILLIFTTNDKIISIAVPLIRIAGIAQLFYGSGIVFAYGLQAAGRSFYVMTADVIINWLIFIPLAYFIAVYLGFGIIGAWASMMFYVVLYSFAMMIKFNLSRWRMEKFN
ncbi:MAG: hypothetical protein D6830_02115 [Ignavibacteria bacterium]|nr:MAG: hypothetical protein D6830_02115 [Ignavibacteria bacterium]